MQLCPTVVLGKPAPVLLEKYDLLIHALEESLKQMKAGVPASTITITMNRIISEAGYGKYCSPPYMRSRGHGFGVGSIAPGGEITDSMKAILVKHQVVAVHPNQYIPETGYLACGESVLVTDTGSNDSPGSKQNFTSMRHDDGDNATYVEKWTQRLGSSQYACGEFQERVKKIKKRMKALGMDVLLAYGYAFNGYGNYCYLTNFSVRLPREPW